MRAPFGSGFLVFYPDGGATGFRGAWWGKGRAISPYIFPRTCFAITMSCMLVVPS
jgi:hypothetical protein